MEGGVKIVELWKFCLEIGWKRKMGCGSFIKLGNGGVPFSFFEITRRHGCYPVNLQHIFLTPLPKNTSGGLLLVPLVFTFSQNIFCVRLLFNDVPYLANLHQWKRRHEMAKILRCFVLFWNLVFMYTGSQTKIYAGLLFLWTRKIKEKYAMCLTKIMNFLFTSI